MTILIVGGTGKTGLKLARLLRAANIPLLITSRSGTAPESFPAVKFNWDDPSTYTAPFDKNPGIDKIYFVGPSAVDMLTASKEFIDVALEKGVKKWVVVSAAQSSKSGVWAGMVHEYLHDKGAVYTILRPSWFYENFSTPLFGESIRTRNEIVSCAEDGRIPFLSAEDIAQAGFEALTTDEYNYKEPYILGPELLTYDEVAHIFSEILGRKITHRRISVEEAIQRIDKFIPHDYSVILVNMEHSLAHGAEEKLFFLEGGKTVRYIGKTTFREYIEANKEFWVA